MMQVAYHIKMKWKIIFFQETMNPKDIMNDAIHNFHPQYQQYTQYTAPAAPVSHWGSIQDNPPPKKSNNSQHKQISTISHNYNEKSTLLSSDDEFQ